MVVSGINPLALSVLAAARAHATNILRIMPPSEARVPYRKNVEKTIDDTLDFEYASSFDSRFNEFVKSSNRKTTYIDKTGYPELVYSMAVRLEKFGKLVFCRQEADSKVILNSEISIISSPLILSIGPGLKV